MKVSRQWLQNFFDAPIPEAQTLADALTFHAFEIDGIEAVGSDSVLDVKVTPNRGHDCLSHRGIAKELSAILRLPLTAQKDPFNRKPDFSKKAEGVSVSIERPDLCKRYIAGYIKGVKVGPSPAWLVQALEAVGQRSINAIVDATNLVMFNIGQPMHAFDAHKLGSLSLGVRPARSGEQLTGLDQKEYSLTESMLLITAGDKAVGIAGIKGGMPAAIDESTTDIILESANFDGVSVRKAAQALKLRTDASARFEQQLSPELAGYAMAQAIDLITSLSGGECVGYVDHYPEPQQQTYASVTVEQVNKVLGTELTGAEVADAFSRLGLPYKEDSGVFEVSVPFERLDLALSEDLIEEVARIVGYDKIPSIPLPPASVEPQINKNFAAAEAARERLIREGYSEVLTSIFADTGERMVLNKVDSVRPYLRDSLLQGLEEALMKNIPNKDLLGLKTIKLFEIGTVWKEGKEVVMLGTAEGEKLENTKASQVWSVREQPLEPMEAEHYQTLAPSQAQRYAEFSKYPYIVRDIALWVPAGTSESEIEAIIRSEAGPLAHKITLFDRFEKGERVSLAFRIIFQSFERTLTEGEAAAAMEKVSTALAARGFEIR